MRVSDTDAFAHINERKRAWQVMQLIRGHAILSFNIPLGPPQYYCARCIRTTESVDIHPLLQSVAVTSDRRIDGYSKETEETNAHLGPQGDERVDKSSSSKDLLELSGNIGENGNSWKIFDKGEEVVSMNLRILIN